MENKMLIILMCAVLIFITGRKQGVGSQNIANCDNFNPLDIRENRQAIIECNWAGSPSVPVVWSIQRGTGPEETVATCAPRCTVHNSTFFYATMTFSRSLLYYDQYDRDADSSARISCARPSDGSTSSTTTTASCMLNVISNAVLTNCFIAYDNSLQKLEGSCDFNKAYSARKSLSCTWSQKQPGEVSFTGKITQTTSHGYTQGTCTFTQSGIQSWEPGKFSYYILFYPSHGELRVSKQNKVTTTTTTTPPAQSTTATKRISLTSFDGENDGSPIELQRGQEAFLMTCRYDNTKGSAGHVTWCRTGSTCGEQSDSAGSNTRSECPEGRRICGTMNGTCAENFDQEVVTQSCEGSEPCGETLTIKKVRECDGGTYSCYVFSSGNVSKYDVASLTVSVKDCEDNKHGPECLDTCGRCAGNQTCNTTTGQCSACLAGWIPPLCIKAYRT